MPATPPPGSAGSTGSTEPRPARRPRHGDGDPQRHRGLLLRRRGVDDHRAGARPRPRHGRRRCRHHRRRRRVDPPRGHPCPRRRRGGTGRPGDPCPARRGDHHQCRHDAGLDRGGGDRGRGGYRQRRLRRPRRRADVPHRRRLHGRLLPDALAGRAFSSPPRGAPTTARTSSPTSATSCRRWPRVHSRPVSTPGGSSWTPVSASPRTPTTTGPCWPVCRPTWRWATGYSSAPAGSGSLPRCARDRTGPRGHRPRRTTPPPRSAPLAARAGAWAVRVHDVAANRAAVDVAHAVATGRGPGTT
jgi:hypothetical protein